MMDYDPGTYYQTPNRHYIRGLPAITRSVYSAICDMSDSKRVCWPSHDKLAEISGCGVTAVKKALKELRELGLLTAQPRARGDGGQTSNVYQIRLLATPPSHETTAPPDAESLRTITNTNYNQEPITNIIGSSEAQPKEKPNKSNPDINAVIEKFESDFNIKLKNARWQRIHASNLIKRYGTEAVIQGVAAAALIRNEQYAPIITDLKDLWNKWDKIAAFYQRKEANQPGGIAIITDD